MKISKVADSYDTYKLEVSFGELSHMSAALQSETNPVADEIRKAIDFYMASIPGPGEDKEDLKAREKEEEQLDTPAEPPMGELEVGASVPEEVPAEPPAPNAAADEVVPEPPAA